MSRLPGKRARPVLRGPRRSNAPGLPDEIELSALTRQCLDRRIDDLDDLNTELAAWQNATNADQRQVDWHFTTSDARTRLRHLYPAY
ncbi:hypothetical protein [Nocardioides speluncae]|uniref:hypothetical protein n=1 Tax=Nocardioides speluncae TaxID=2670337 RepID=UPI001981EB39|nr:hypothetical protein [Nocardioides speluncae]